MLTAGFSQIEAQVMKAGMVGEAACISKPMTIIPMVVTQVQDLIASGQMRASEQLIDAQQVTVPGTITVYLEPLYQGRARRRAAGQQLHRQRLHQQSRPARRSRHGHLEVAVPACHRHGRRGACDHPEDPGAAAAGADAGALRRALIGCCRGCCLPVMRLPLVSAGEAAGATLTNSDPEPFMFTLTERGDRTDVTVLPVRRSNSARKAASWRFPMATALR